jgi:hypothetical protein
MTDPTHLTTTALDGYLRHALPADEYQKVRVHLDHCELCWQAWNRYRWDTARASPLYAQLAEFLGEDLQPYYDSSRALATDWDRADPHTTHEIADFFRRSTSYLYNLTIWEASGNRPDYLQAALPVLLRHGSRRVLDYGCGIGSDTLRLHHGGYDVTGCDFQSPSTAFLRWRSGNTIPVIEPSELDRIPPPDTLWIIDTLDHLSDIEDSLGSLLSVADLVICENIAVQRTHGRQRFHHRRPHSEITELFSSHGLAPSTTTPDVIMFWMRA